MPTPLFLASASEPRTKRKGGRVGDRAQRLWILRMRGQQQADAVPPIPVQLPIGGLVLRLAQCDQVARLEDGDAVQLGVGGFEDGAWVVVEALQQGGDQLRGEGQVGQAQPVGQGFGGSG